MTHCAAVFDIGTSSIKGALISDNGTVYTQNRLFFPDEVLAEHWFTSFGKMFKQFSVFSETSNIVITGISISCNGPSLVAVSGDNSKLLLWNKRLTKGDNFNNKSDSDILKPEARPCLTKTANSKSIFLPRFELFSILFPEEFTDASFIFSGQEFLVYKLTSKKVTVLPEKRYGSAYWTNEDLSLLNINKNKIPPFVEPGTFCGTYLNIPVFAGVPDFIAALIGTNTLMPGTACDRAGSSEGINICIKEKPPSEKLDNVRLLPSPITPFWNISYIIPDSGSAFYNFIKKNGGTYSDFNSFMTKVAAIRNREKCLVTGTTKNRRKYISEKNAEECNLLIEEIAHAVKNGMDILEKAAGFTPEYTMCGGQAKSGLWLKIKEEITGRKFSFLQIADAELLGNAAIVFTSLGVYKTLTEAAQVIVKKHQTIPHTAIKNPNI